MPTNNVDLQAVNARLADAAETGQTLEVILVLRGKIRPGRNSGRWRIRCGGGRVLTFEAESVVAATPLAPVGVRAVGSE